MVTITKKAVPAGQVAPAAPAAPAAAPTPDNDPLEKLAESIDFYDVAGGDNKAADAEKAAADESAAQMQKVTAGLGAFGLKVAKALRQRAARNLPELLEHVTDADLQTFADALPPVIQKHMQKLAPIMGQYPEEAMLLLSTVPLAMGYMSALEHHSANADQLRRQAQAKAVEHA